MVHAQSQRTAALAAGALAVILAAATAVAQQRSNVAVFNFQMKSDTSDWVWLEKGLADQITTDFVRAGNGLTVLARDDMQSAADKVRWTPELLSDERGMLELKKSITVEKIVTGVYTVQGERISITAQVVQVSTREVKDRQEVAGKVSDVLDLQRQLSAKLVGYFTGKAADKVLPELPVWTRSIPATRALYEGMNLYDQGRFGEAWLRFRQASRDDGGYLEAQYWVGKMYYFMDRYEHARRAFERFLYMDQNHPRIGDAIKEYLHTYEKLDASVDVLASLYEDLGRRYPEAKMFGELGLPGAVPGQPWLWAREAQALGLTGRFREASELVGKAMERIGGFAMDAAATWYVRANNQIHGGVLLPEGMARAGGWQRLQFEAGSTTARLDLKSPVRPGARVSFYLLAPDGYVFKKLHLAPVSDSGAVAAFSFWNWRINDIAPDGNGTDAVFDADGGQTFSKMPRLGLSRAYMRVQSGKGRSGSVTAIRAEAELEKLGPAGSIYPYTSTLDAAFEVDGYAGGWGVGPVAGLLPSGEYTVRVQPSYADSPWAPCQVKAVVRAGEITPLVVRMPWKAGSPFEGWSQCVTSVPGQVGLQEYAPTVRLLADEKAIRAIVHYQGDIWTMVSTDGNTFSKAVKAPLPVSTGWSEINPVCIRDESGRFLLAFVSDRNGQHQLRAYLSWSRDFVNWSSPSLIVPDFVRSYDLIQDPQGRFLFAMVRQGKVVVLASRDAYRWEELAVVQPRGGSPQQVRLTQSAGGGPELLFNTPGGLEHHTSLDGKAWTYAGRAGDGGMWVAVPGWECAEGRLVAMNPTGVGKRPNWENHIQLFRRKDTGAWEQSKAIPGFTSNGGGMTYHPRWGYVMAWTANRCALRVGDQDWGGCWVLIVRGPSIDAFFRPEAASSPTSRPVGPKGSARQSP